MRRFSSRTLSSNIRDESNVVHISGNVDPRLLAESNLENAISLDYDRKYWLAINGNVYIYDYTIKEWYIYDNIHATCFLEKDGDLLFGDNNGMVYRFMKRGVDVKPYSDDGQPINAYWYSKHFTFGADEMRKLVEKVFYSFKPGTRTSVDLYYQTNKKLSDLVKTKRLDLLNFTNLDFNHFSFLMTNFPQDVMVKVKQKKITHFQLRLVNDKLDESMGILSIGIKFRYQSEVK